VNKDYERQSALSEFLYCLYKNAVYDRNMSGLSFPDVFWFLLGFCFENSHRWDGRGDCGTSVLTETTSINLSTRTARQAESLISFIRLP